MKQAFKAVDKKFLVDYHYNSCKKKLQNPYCNVIICKKWGHRPAPHHMAHGKIHEDNEKACGTEQPFFQYGSFMVSQHIFVFRCPGRSMIRYALFRCAVSCLLYRGYDSLWICVSFYAHGICQKAHGTGSNAGDVIHGFFHPGAAGRAAHAGYGILFHKHQCLLYFISFCRVFISSSIT